MEDDGTAGTGYSLEVRARNPWGASNWVGGEGQHESGDDARPTGYVHVRTAGATQDAPVVDRGLALGTFVGPRCRRRAVGE